MNKEGRTYFEVIEDSIGVTMRRLASYVIPNASLKVRILLSLLSALLLFMSVLAIYSFYTYTFYSSIPGWAQFVAYEITINACLFFGAFALLFEKRLGWIIVSSFLVLRLLPRIDKLIYLFVFNEDWVNLTEYLYGTNMTVTLITLVIVSLLLIGMYSKVVRSLYKVGKMEKVIPVVLVLLLGSLRMVLNNLL